MTADTTDKTQTLRRATKRRMEELDWDFATQRSESTFSKLHWHPCRFPSQIPATAISRLSNKGGTILDPFMGSATSLVEAQRLGRASIGVDINPISVLMAESKLVQAKEQDIVHYISRLTAEIVTQWESIKPAQVPETVQVEKWYAPETLHGLGKIRALIGRTESDFSLIGEAAFSSTLLPVCKETRHWGYVCDNSNPKTNRVGDARSTFLKNLAQYKTAYEARATGQLFDVPSAQVHQGDAREVLQSIADDSIELLVTSPPYFGVADYAKAQRLSMEWFGFEIEPVRKGEIGARSKRHRKTADSDFLNELKAVFIECHRVLRSGSYAAVVFGSSPSRKDTLPGFLDDLKAIGFTLEANITRSISSMRRQSPSLSTERVTILRKS